MAIKYIALGIIYFMTNYIPLLNVNNFSNVDTVEVRLKIILFPGASKNVF